MRVARYVDLTPASWRNGGGVTRQIAVFPPEAGLEDFHWRVSMAVVGSDGPFSVFPDVDRVLWLLSGDGMELRRQDGSSHVLHPGERLDFPADEQTEALLPGGPVEDLNIMTNRRFATALVRNQRVDGECVLEVPGERSVIFVLRGHITAADLPGSPRLGARDCLLSERRAEKVAIAGAADLIVIGFDQAKAA
jgi:environmental stress-induced protein Ves